MRKWPWIASIFTILVAASAAAATPKTAPPLPSLQPSDLKISGYVDVSYNYLVRRNRFISGAYDREYDLEPNGFTLQQAALSIAKQPSQGLGGLINGILGRDALTIAPKGLNPNIGIQNIGFTVSQAFAQYISHNTTTLAGEFDALTGLEGYASPQNTNFSRSILDQYAEPGQLLGARIIQVVNDTLSLDMSINNGWNEISDTSRRKTIEYGATYQPNTQLALSFHGYNGQERINTNLNYGPAGIRNLIDITAGWLTTPQLKLSFAYDYGLQNRAALPNNLVGEAFWQGVAGYLNYQFSSSWYSAFRAEIFNDPQGYLTGVRQVWKEVTLTCGYTGYKNFILRAETRHDFSNTNAFVNQNGAGTNHNQQSFALEGVYSF